MATATKTRKKSDFDLNQVVTDKLIEAMESGTAPWKSPYLVRGLPMSMSTGKMYRGINPLLLTIEAQLHGYSSPWWGTFDQIAERAGCVKVYDEETGFTNWQHPSGQPAGVRKGEKSTLVTFWKRYQRDAKDENGNTIYENGQPKKKTAAMLRYFRVFNADQADWPDGVPTKFAPAERGEDFDPIDEADTIVLGYTSNGGPAIQHLDQTVAWYAPKMDVVNVPNPENIRGNDEYYSALFHELGHSTGHAERLNRPGIADLAKHGRGKVYAAEELVAEMSAAMLCGHAGIQDTIDNSAAYLRGWASYLKDDPKAAVRAASQAQKAVDLILGESFDDNNEES